MADPTNMAPQPQAQQPQQPQAQQGPGPKIYQPDFSKTDYSSEIKRIQNVMDNMQSGAQERLLLSGDTGIGKTSFVKQFSKMLGLPCVVIEIPHAVEEELINIPFIVYNTNGTRSSGSDQFNKKTAELVLGRSHLVSKLEQLRKVPDAAWPATIQSYDNKTQELMRQYEARNPKEIDSIRSNYERILFFDEFLRATTKTIRNILGDVLNGSIGNDDIPEGTYIMYASNIHDAGIDKTPSHRGFAGHNEFVPPSKDQWLNHTVSDAMHKKVQFKQDVIDAFNKHMTDEHVSYTDVEADIRTSPRRWSEILLYINNAYPFKSAESYAITRTTLRRQMQGDATTDGPRGTSSLSTILESILAALAVKSKINPQTIPDVPATEWRNILKQQIETAMDIGENKKYVPVIEGLPGIGKTAISQLVEAPLKKNGYNLRFISIKCTNLSTDDVSGIALPDEKEKGQMNTDFSKSPLQLRIEQYIRLADQEYLNDLKEYQQNGDPKGVLNGRTAEQVYRDYENQEYKYLIFFDEINRVNDVNVFNSLRRVILEKEFNDVNKLPAKSIVVGAMNPADNSGYTKKFTKHFRDAVDVIDAVPDWKQFKAHMEGTDIPLLKDERPNISDLAVRTAYDVIVKFPTIFSDKKIGREGNEFYISPSKGGNDVYVSPRDYRIMFREIAIGVNRVISHVQQDQGTGGKISPTEVNQRIADMTYEKLIDKLTAIYHTAKQGLDPEFPGAIKKFLNSTIKVALTKKTAQTGLSELLTGALASPGSLQEENEFINYMKTVAASPAAFTKEFTGFLTDTFGTMNEGTAKQECDKLVTLVQDMKNALDVGRIKSGIEDYIGNTLADFYKHIIKKIATGRSGSNDVPVYIAKTYIKALDILGK
jgi:MoxR-like ATPase